MRRRVESFGQVTMGAEGVASAIDLQTVRVMAVAAGDASTVHLALQKRPVLIHLILDLAISIIEALLQQRGTMGIHERSARHVAVVEDAAPGMAAGTRFDLETCREGCGAFGAPGVWIHHPSGVIPACELHHQTLGRLLRCRYGAPGPGPRHMP